MCKCEIEQEKTRSPAVAKMADRTGFQWPSKSSKVDHFHLIWKGICNFLLVINSNVGAISHRFRDTATYSLQIPIENCGQIAADGNMFTIDSIHPTSDIAGPLRLTI